MDVRNHNTIDTNPPSKPMSQIEAHAYQTQKSDPFYEKNFDDYH